MSWTTEALTPFGLCVRCDAGTSVDSFTAEQLHGWVTEHGVVVIRGAEPTAKRDLPAVARRLGPLLPWSFGSINELKVDPAKRNYLFTEREVPLHWDGAFVGVIPRYLFFQCVMAPPEGTGGETLFADTRRVLEAADDETLAAWRRQVVRYQTDKIVHYGGEFTSPVIAPHPMTGVDTIRYAEPVVDLNPVRAEPLGDADADAFHEDMHKRLFDPDAMYAHVWEDGDYVIADNHTLLHGRNAFTEPAARYLQRINVLDPGRDDWQWLWDSLRIRRPEFMVAEIPILLIATLLAAPTLAVFGTGTWWLAVVVFFLMFHFGDIINCLADRDLDAVYKTKQSEAVYGLGVANVRMQLAVTTALALGLSVFLGRWWLTLLVALGLAWGSQYSVGPLHLKSRGLWQVVTLIGIIFVGPMLFIGGVAGGFPGFDLLIVAVLYGVMQQGTILVNTAEDYREDLEAGLHTSAIELGPRRTVALAWTMVAVGGSGLLAWFGSGADTTGTTYALGLFTGAWIWVLLDVGTLWWALRGQSDETVDAMLKSWALRMPLWITTLAWSVLFTTWMGHPW